MKERTTDKYWFPWWPDKWIFGSIRIECTLVERGIWVDLLSLASKDNGHIRANEETPYPIQQLSGMLIIPEDILKKAIGKFIKNKKITRMKNNTLYVTKWEKYQFCERHKRRVEKEMSENPDTIAEKNDPIIYNSIKENSNNIKEKTEKPLLEKKEIDIEFEDFWKGYKSMGNHKDDIGNKQEAKKAFKTLRKRISKEELLKALIGEENYLKYKINNENFSKRKKFASTWLRSDLWKEHKDFKYTARL